MKTEMVARPLSERQVLPYLVVSVVLYSMAGYIPQSINNRWDALGAICSVLLTVLGTIYIYRQNGGAEGEHFLQRYLALGWVVALRWCLAFLFVAFAFYVILSAVGADTTSTHWYDFLLVAIGETIIYWRIGHHVRDLAQRTMPT